MEGTTDEAATEHEEKAKKLQDLISQKQSDTIGSTASIAARAALNAAGIYQNTTGVITTTTSQNDTVPPQVSEFATKVAEKIIGGMNDVRVVLDTGALVGGLTDEMDKSLGAKFGYQTRGVMG